MQLVLSATARRTATLRQQGNRVCLSAWRLNDVRLYVKPAYNFSLAG